MSKGMDQPIEFYGDSTALISIPLNDDIVIEVYQKGIFLLSGNNDVTSKYFITEQENRDIPATAHNLWAVLDIMRSNIKKEA